MRLPTAPQVLRIAAALSSGVALVFISAPANLHYLHWFSFLPLFWALRPGEHRANFALGYASGWLAVFILFRWLIQTIVIFTGMPLVAAVLVHMLFATAFSIPYAIVFGSVQWLRERLGGGWVALTPAVLVAAERLSPALFPYYQGVSQYRNPYTWQLASVLGVLGVSYLILLVNAALAEALIYGRAEGRRPPWTTLGVVGALFLGNIAYGAWRLPRIEAQLAAAPTLKVSMLQDDSTMVERMHQSGDEELAPWIALTREILGQDVDLLIWPEGAMPYNPTGISARKLLGGLAQKMDADFLVGGGTVEKAPPESGYKYRSYNSCYMFNKKGELAGRYDKMVPVPFGEIFPFRDTFPWLPKLVGWDSDFSAGTEPTVFQADGYTFTSPICYEAILDHQMWNLKDADLFVNITNDAWFGNTAAPHQHAMLAAVQATQYGRPLVRIACTGVNFIVEPHGRILEETVPFTPLAKVGTVRMVKVDTLYVLGGRNFAWLCVAVSIGAAIYGRRR